MAKRRNSKDMRQVYLIRRVVAVLIIILILVAIFTKCSNRDKTNEKDPQTTPQTTETQIDEIENNEPNIINGVPDENNLNGENEVTGDTPEVEDNEIPEIIAANESRIQNEYDEHATVEYRNDAFFFDFKGDTRTMVISRDETEYEEEFAEFWDTFKYNLTKSSETLAETVEPGIELHVVDPKDDRSTMLLIKDGSTIFNSIDN